jgi:hypothetical protein
MENGGGLWVRWNSHLSSTQEIYINNPFSATFRNRH